VAALITYCNHMDHLCISAELGMVEKVANQLLAWSHTNPTILPPIVGSKWVQRFKWRHLELHMIRQKGQELVGL
jgi:hypothetical protein